MSKKVEAIFSDKAYEDFISGNAVDNNGLRSPKGYFYPDQPEFRLKSENRVKMEDAATDIGIAAAAYVVLRVILPNIGRFFNEKIYPFFTEKWDNWRRSRQKPSTVEDSTQDAYEESMDSGDGSNVIQFPGRTA